MGSRISASDPGIADISNTISTSIQYKTVLQYQINQLKSLVEQKKAFPDITEVKESQLQNIKLAKELKDTENLLSSIKGCQDESLASLEETYLKLKSKLEQTEQQAFLLEEEVSNEAKILELNQARLKSLTEENEKLQMELDDFKNSEKFEIIQKHEENIGSLGFSSTYLTPQGGFLDKNSRREMIRSRQEVFLEINSELQRMNDEEKQLLQIIQEAEMKKLMLERNRSEIELRKHSFHLRSPSPIDNSFSHRLDTSRSIENPYTIRVVNELNKSTEKKILEISRF